MEKTHIPFSVEPVDDCRECTAACCRANMILHLTIDEVSMMLKAGNKLLTVAQPMPFDREEIIYPVGREEDPETGRAHFLLEVGREYEPLAANLGRYILLNDCAFLATDANGWQYCSTYDTRPGNCVEFEPGSEKCHIMQQPRLDLQALMATES